MNGRTPPRHAGLLAALIYLVVTLAMTWPLPSGMARDVPGDLGDSLLNMWILGWGAEQVPRVLTGQASLTDYWNANIFHPELLALGFSEHLFGELVQVLPVYWLTGNLILCYNLLFLSSFVLSGVGMFVLVRDLLSGAVHEGPGAPVRDERTLVAAAFVAGLIFAFIPFRIAQVAHIQSLQAQWMPLALFGFRRYIMGGHARALVGGTAALLMQNWSNGYYLIFFAPFVPLFVVHQMWAARQLLNWRRWAGFAVSAAVTIAGTLPFLALYLETERVHGLERPVGEVIRFSADVFSYFTAPDALRLWGGVLQAYPKPEGELFFGLIPWLLTAIALAVVARGTTLRRTPGAVSQTARWSSYGSRVLLLLIAVQVAGVVAILLTGGFITSIAGIPIRATNPVRIVTGIAIAATLLLAISPPTRARLEAAARSPLGLSLVLMLLAVWLSLGPAPQSLGRPLPDIGLYRVLYEQVPGFDGLRVPARYAMIAAVFLSIAAGFGAARLIEWSRGRVRHPGVVGIALSAAFLVEAAFLPMTVNASWGDGGMQPPSRIEPRANAPAVYDVLAALPYHTVVAEFPFGDPAWDLRYVYYSTIHWKRLVNGYSGGFPQRYQVRVALLGRVQENPDAAWRALREAGTTHVVVHQGAMTRDQAAYIVKWLTDRFAVEIARFDGGDLLFDVSGVWPPPR